MRIISGKYRGRQINPPSGFTARPTTDYARESLFNILNNRIDFEAVEVLDLFSGTGSISFEFASRGAVSVHLVEKDYKSISFIRRMKEELGMENLKPVHIDVKAFIRTCNVKYDVVFADPPYDLSWLPEIPAMVINASLLKENGFLVVEHPATYKFGEEPGFFEHRSYGSVNFSFFRQPL